MTPGEQRLLVLYTPDGSVSPAELVHGLDRRAVEFAVLADEPEVRASLVDYFAEAGPVVAAPTTASARDVVAVRSGPDPCGVLTFSESAVSRCAELADHYGTQGNSASSILACRNKSVQRRLLREAGVPSAQSWAMDKPSQWAALRAMVEGPVVVKPQAGAGSRRTYRVDDADLPSPVRAAMAGGERFVVEEMLHGQAVPPFGDYVSVESLVQAGTIRHFGVTGKLPLTEPFRENGQFFPADYLKEDLRRQVLAVTSAAIRAVGLTNSIVHTELKLTSQGPRIIEVNGRLGGFLGDLIRRSTGVEVIDLLAAVAAGEPVHWSEPVATQVAFTTFSQPPLSATSFDGIDGVGTVRELATVRTYQILKPPGFSLAGSTETQYIDLMRGEAADSAQVLATLRRAMDALTFRFESADGALVVPGRCMPGVRALMSGPGAG